VASPHDAVERGGAPEGDAHPAAPAGAGEPPRGGLGILGGSFNPPHRGHVALARHALRELGLGRVLLMPARVSPGKPVEDEPNPAYPQHRLEMCRLVAEDVEGVEACALEVERDGPSYTVDTLRALHDEHPDTELTFILGADVASTLPTWHEAAALPALARFAVALRVGGRPIAEPDRAGLPTRGWRSRPQAGWPKRGPIGETLAPLASPNRPAPQARVTRLRSGPSFSIIRLHMPMIDVSSSLVRERVRRGLSVEELVGRAVASYIAEHSLYRATNPTGGRGIGSVASGGMAPVRANGGDA
jgi:nicotinate-nucleotide adenylyltransferase